MRQAVIVIAALVACLPAALCSAAAINIAVDLDSKRDRFNLSPTSVQTMPGFTSWDVTNIPMSGASKIVDGITFDLFGFNLPLQSRYRSPSFVGDVPGDALLRDFVYNEAIPGDY